MDELEISGKRYISTRRAAREHGYHSDYMGQLIRGKKVAGQKVGRAWYIEEESLNAYLGKEPAPAPVASAAAPTEVPVPIERLVLEENVSAAETEPQPVSVGMPPAPEPESVVEIKKQEDAQPIAVYAAPEVQPIAVRIEPQPEPVYAQPVAREIHHAPYIEEHETRIPIHTEVPAVQAPVLQEAGGLRYAADDAPSMPIVTRTSAPKSMPQMPVHTAAPHAYAPGAQQSARSFPYVSLSVVAIMAIVAATFASNFVTATVVSAPGKAATVQYAIHW